MDKKDKVLEIIRKIREQAEELVDDDQTDLMSEEEIVVLSTELVTSSSVTTIEYSYPIAMVDKSNMTFVLEDDFEIPVYGGEDEE